MLCLVAMKITFCQLWGIFSVSSLLLCAFCDVAFCDAVAHRTISAVTASRKIRGKLMLHSYIIFCDVLLISTEPNDGADSCRLD